MELALDRFGRLDAAVLNAGIGGGGPLEATGAVERFDRIIAVNLSGVMLGIRAAIPALRAAGGGSIVATSSVSGLRADPGTWAYAASNAAVINLVRATAIDYAAENIRINAIAPGGTVTALTTGQQADPDGTAITRRIPQQRWAQPRGQAEVVWFLRQDHRHGRPGRLPPAYLGSLANRGTCQGHRDRPGRRGRPVAAALRERASRHGHSLQQELLSILESAAAEPASSTTAPPPIRLKTVRTGGTSTWSREEIYGDEGR